MTWRERWHELKRIYGGHQREVRLTAVGWNPGGWTEDSGPTSSGNREYFIVVREGETEAQPESLKETRRIRTQQQEGLNL